MHTPTRRHRFTITMALQCALFPAALALLSLAGVPLSAAQAAAGQPPPQTPPKPHHFKHRVPAKPAAASPPIAAAPVAPPAPDWPVNDKPEPPAVSWDSQGLRINAVNSSLQQILADVASQTGVKVEGLSQDQRVFGVFGPGQPRDVLSQLLQGSGYNIVMVGDQGKGVPRSILLTSRKSSGPAVPSPRTAQQPGEEDDDGPDNPVDPQPPPPPAPAVFNPIPTGQGPVRTPQELMQEIQQRQQQMQQQQGQPPNPQPPPNQ